MHSVDSDSSLFSQGSSISQSAGLWTDSGLPGVDFSAGLASGLGSSIPAVPPRLQMLWAGSNGVCSSQPNGATAAAASSGYTTPSIPPGFGGSSGLGVASSRFGSSNNSRLLNGSYNPLSYSDPGTKGSQQSTLLVPPGFGGLAGLGAAGAEAGATALQALGLGRLVGSVWVVANRIIRRSYDGISLCTDVGLIAAPVLLLLTPVLVRADALQSIMSAGAKLGVVGAALAWSIIIHTTQP